MKTNKKGFTIIEVVLVLAIAGLIFLMVFIALPALQRSQRNTQREDDLARVLTAVNEFQTNNNGKTPFNGLDLVSFVTRYLDKEGTGGNSTVTATAGATTGFTACGKQFSDPDGTPYQVKYVREVASTQTAAEKITDDEGVTADFNHTFYAYTNAGCGDEGMVEKAVIAKLLSSS